MSVAFLQCLKGRGNTVPYLHCPHSVTGSTNPYQEPANQSTVKQPCTRVHHSPRLSLTSFQGWPKDRSSASYNILSFQGMVSFCIRIRTDLQKFFQKKKIRKKKATPERANQQMIRACIWDVVNPHSNSYPKLRPVGNLPSLPNHTLVQ